MLPYYFEYLDQPKKYIIKNDVITNDNDYILIKKIMISISVIIAIIVIMLIVLNINIFKKNF